MDYKKETCFNLKYKLSENRREVLKKDQEGAKKLEEQNAQINTTALSIAETVINPLFEELAHLYAHNKYFCISIKICSEISFCISTYPFHENIFKEYPTPIEDPKLTRRMWKCVIGNAKMTGIDGYFDPDDLNVINFSLLLDD